MQAVQSPEAKKHIDIVSTPNGTNETASRPEYFQIRYLNPGCKIDINIVNKTAEQIVQQSQRFY
jgi:hypothetical protein